MAMRKTVFVTGGTGFLGAFLTNFFLRHDYHVVALVRGPEAEGRLLATLQEIHGGVESVFLDSGYLEVVEGDVRLPGFGLSTEKLTRLVDAVDEIWHCAASFKFQERCREEIAAHNIAGTRNVLDFARACNRRRKTLLFHMSTAYAAPLIEGVVREELPPLDTPFRNRYEWSKQEAERLVGDYRQRHDVPAFICRPSVIIGHSSTGHATRFTGYYDVIRAIYQLTRNLEVNLGESFDRNLRLRILAGADVRLNVVPVDFVVEAMWRIARTEPPGAWIFNLTNDRPPLLNDLFQWACAPLAVKGIELVDDASFVQRPMSGLERMFNRKTQFQAAYLLDGPIFDNGNFRALVPETLLPCPQVDEALMRRINEYYYHDVLDRRFGVQRQSLTDAPRDTRPSNEFSETGFRATA